MLEWLVVYCDASNLVRRRDIRSNAGQHAVEVAVRGIQR